MGFLFLAGDFYREGVLLEVQEESACIDYILEGEIVRWAGLFGGKMGGVCTVDIFERS